MGGRWYCDYCANDTGWGVSFATKAQCVDHVKHVHHIEPTANIITNYVLYITRFACDFCGWDGRYYATWVDFLGHFRAEHADYADISDMTLRGSSYAMHDDTEDG